VWRISIILSLSSALRFLSDLKNKYLFFHNWLASCWREI